MATNKDMGIATAAQKVPISESGLRYLDRLGVVKPSRDPWGRRLFGPDDVEAARRYLSRKRAGRGATV